MRDRAFSGQDVAEALRTAAETLGLPAAELRYFVLDAGRPGGLGVRAREARIAVLMPDAAQAGLGPGPAPGSNAAPEEDEELDVAIQGVVGGIGRAAGFPLSAELLEDRSHYVIRLSGGAGEFFLGEDGRGEVLRAVEHLLLRMFALDVAPLKLRVELAGYREHRDARLRAQALALAAEVKRDARARESEPLNGYERRIIHLAVAEVGGLVSKSIGEGAERRVTISKAVCDAGSGGEVF